MESGQLREPSLTTARQQTLHLAPAVIIKYVTVFIIIITLFCQSLQQNKHIDNTRSRAPEKLKLAAHINTVLTLLNLTIKAR